MSAATISQGEHSYFLSAQRNRYVPWLLISFLLHVLLFGLAWMETRRMQAPNLVHQTAIMVQPVRWAPEERPEHWLPRVEATPEPAKPEAVKVSPNPETPKKKPDPPKKEPKKEPPKKDPKQRKTAMNKALEKIRNNYNSWDGSPNGVKGAPSARALQILGSVYAGQLREVFSSHWTVPKVISERDLEHLTCKILVKIDRTGTISGHKLVTSSGNAQFDSSAMRAVKLTPKVPLPDEMLRDVVFNDGILINFSKKD